MSAPLDALVLDLDTRAGLCIARSLGRAGLRVGVAARDGKAPGLRTRHAAARHELPEPAQDFAAYADAIAAAVRDRPAGAILPSIDSSVAALDARRSELAPSAPAIAAPDALALAVSKERTLALAAELGVPAPRSLRAATVAEVVAAGAELGLPVVLKPERSWRSVDDGGERVAPTLAATPEELRTAAAALVRPDAPVLVQELAPGRRETVKLVRAGGRWLARVVIVVERCWPPLGGSSTMRRTVAAPEDVLRHGERLVEAMGLEGYAEAEFRRDARGRPLLMEVNPRLSQSVEVAVRAGVDLPRLQLEWARGGRLEPVSRYAVGLRVGWLGGEARLLAAAALGAGEPPRPALGATARGLARDWLVGRARVEGLDLRDPAPALGSLAAGARAALRRG